VVRLHGPSSERSSDELPLSTVLDELRTPSFFSPVRLVIVENAGAFLKEYRDDLIRFVDSGFSAGHLILLLDSKPDARTKLVQAVARLGWAVTCEQPYNRPPPWETRTPVWESPLSRWVVEQAKSKKLEIDLRAAFDLHERVGNDLGSLDDALEKLATYLAATGSKRVDDVAIRAITGDTRDESLFVLTDLVLEGRRADALDSLERLFDRGWHTGTNVVVDPAGIVLPWITNLLNRLRHLRRAHAMQSIGMSSDDWIRAGLVQRPFLPRFRRQLDATPPDRIRRLIDRLHATDLGIKSGGDPRGLARLILAE
ncbi:MAG TPA: hypothetical protein VK116_03830, partial [Planctomycetota bacterium]|nr:hypothetical protein [Planctomycetota bacterium]